MATDANWKAEVHGQIGRDKRHLAVLVLVAVALISGLVIASGEARSSSRGGGSSSVGPVSRRLLVFVNSHGPMAFRLAGSRAKPKITVGVAFQDALRHSRWHPVAMRGISLVRFAHRTGDIPAGTLGWLASIKPRKPVYDGTKASPGQAANYFVIVIRARDGRFLAAEDGYSAALANRSGRRWVGHGRVRLKLRSAGTLQPSTTTGGAALPIDRCDCLDRVA